MKKRSKLFIYEHGVCEEEIPDEIAVEGLAMFKAMLNFNKYFDLISYVRNEFLSLFNFPNCCFDECLDIAEKALIVAPENNFILLNLTKKIEKSGVENLGSSSKAIEITSDKWKTYKKLKGKVNMPKTSLKPLDCKYLVKPRISCGGNGIKIGGDVKDGFIAQEFIDGDALSVSLYVGDDIKVLSVNKQILENFAYKGAIVPANVSNKEIVEEAISAVEKIKGLNGYVGVDLVLSDQPYIIEVNARLTTPFVAFEHVYGFSYAEMLLNLLKGKDLDIKPKRKIILYKSKGNNGFITYKSYCLVIKDLNFEKTFWRQC